MVTAAEVKPIWVSPMDVLRAKLFTWTKMSKGNIAKCDPFNPSNHGCPNGFTCQWSIRTQRYSAAEAKSRYLQL
ncbi:hypothetical protein COOONC_05551 [Cooperia oncophora]